MNCLTREDLTLRRTAQSPVPLLTGAELAHVGGCPRCRAVVAESADAAAILARNSSERGPDARYWASVVPSVRKRIEDSSAGTARSGFAAVARTLMPAAGVVAMVIALTVTAVRQPPALSGGELLATLSDIELQELRQSGTYTNLLESHEWNGGEEESLSDIIADLLLENTDGGLGAITDPEEALRYVDEGDLAEIVSTIKYQ